MLTYPIRPIGEDPAGKLAGMVVNTGFEEFSAEMVEASKRAVFDTISVMVAGSSWECVPQAADLARTWSGSGESRILIYGYQVPSPLAAWVNGTMARAIDMGDVHTTGGHVSEWIVPVLLSALPLAGHKVSGREFLSAYMAAAEVGVRVHTAIGLHTHAVGVPNEFGGPLSSTAAVSRLLGLTVEQTWNALGMTYSVHSLSEGEKYAEGAQTVRLQHGFAGQTAIQTTLLARRGIKGPLGVFLGPAGGAFRHIEWDDVDVEALSRDLGKTWVFDGGLSIKPYASCKYTHSIIAAIFALKRKYSLEPALIRDIHCLISEGAKCCVEPAGEKWAPHTAAEAIFSIPYVASHALLCENVFLDAFFPEELERADKRALMKLVRVDVDSEISDPFEGYTVEITMRDGTVYRETADYVLGHPKNPMCWGDLRDKFRTCTTFSAVQLPEASFDRAEELCLQLLDVEDMEELVQALIP